MIGNNLANIKRRIGQANTTLIAVSKTRSVQELQYAIDVGQRHFGENYLQEALPKIDALQGRGLIWHFIGPIQSNKSAKIAQHFDWVHSVDNIKIAQRLNNQRPKNLPKLNVLLQVNIDDEPSKSGASVDDIDAMVSHFREFDQIVLRGFMCIPKPNNSPSSFMRMSALFKCYQNLDMLSMGMSNDFELAIKFGATFVRVGTDIFGNRP